MTNYDSITMDVDILSDFLSRSMCCDNCWNYGFCHSDKCENLKCKEVWIKWLLEDR